MICTIPGGTTSYEVIIKSGLLQEISSFTSFNPPLALITDDTTAQLYGKELYEFLCRAEIKTHFFTLPVGEIHKTRAVKETLENQLFEKHLGKDTCILALGGGVVTDLVGYLAATYCRGVPFVIIPTTLLAMADACIGGKTGVDVPYGKNLIGCIYQPHKVLIDPLTLKSLPLKELKNGVVEIIKHALLADSTLFEYLRQHSHQFFTQDPQTLEYLIQESCRIKIEIVAEDEKERGKRRLINFGHTVGHALEKTSNYTLSHGEAVAIGMLVESYMALQLGFLKKNTLDKIHDILLQYALPLSIPLKISTQSIMDAMILDKKSHQGHPRFALIQDIGAPLHFNGTYCTEIEESILLNALNWMCHDLCRH
jgi:3-dehydroquinate synthase